MAKVKSANEKRAKPRSHSKLSGLTLPVGRIHRKLRHGNYADRVGSGAAVYMAAVLEYLVSEVIELGGEIARKYKKSRIIPRHLHLAIRTDAELSKLFESVIISTAGVVPHIEDVLLPKISSAKK